MNYKRKLIKELRETFEREEISIQQFLEMLEFASTVELSMLKSNLQKIIRIWRETQSKKSLFLH